MRYTKKLIFVLLTTIIVLILPNYANSQPTKDKIGFATLALTSSRFNCNSFMSSIKSQKHLHIAFLYNTFGKNYKCLDRILSDSRLQTIQIHLINGPGHRNKRLEKHEFLYGVPFNTWSNQLIRKNAALKRRFFKYIKPMQQKVSKLSVNCLISPELEANLSSRAGKTLVEWTKEAFPSCSVVWNPLVSSPAKRTQTSADFIEGHGHSPKLNSPCVVNLDGTDISFGKERISPAKKFFRRGQKNWIESGSQLKKWITKYTKLCDIAFLWIVEYNCINPANKPDKFERPTIRQCQPGKSNKLIEKELNKF